MTATKYTQEELTFRTEMATKLASIEGKVDTLNARLEPLLKLNEIVIEHDRQISRWKGVNATLAILFGAAVTILSHWYIKFKGAF